MQKKQTILVVASLLVVVLSVTLAYFTAQIVGKGKDVSVSSADLKIVFTDTDGNIEGSNITPGWSNSKTFTVKNESNGTYKYDIIIKDLVNTFKTYKYLQYKINSTDGGYNMTDHSYLPKSSTKEDVALAYEISIDKGKTHTYTIEIKYANDESVDQSIDMGKSLSGTIYIREFTKPTMKLTDKLMADNPTIKTRTDFNTIFTETNTGRLYKATEQIGTNPVKDVYYFAGDAKNNWVKFGKTTESSCTYKGKEVLFANMSTGTMRNPENETECTSTNICDAGENGYGVGLTESECSGFSGTKWTTEKATWNETTSKDVYWRIIRTNADGSIRMLYSGTSHNTTEGYIGVSAFNSTYKDPMYVGYMYGTSGSLASNRDNTNNSTVKTYIDNWYNNNLSSYSKYISTEAVYCNDRELEPGHTYSTSSGFHYASYGRLYTNKTPTYNCTNIKDAFSGSNAEAKLTSPIGLMTADEIVYAGGKYFTELPTPYAWYYLNSAGGSITGGTYWWLMSPMYLSSNNSFVWLIRGSSDPGFSSYAYVQTDLNSARPAISLKTCTKYSTGDGTAENPYTILETESGC